MELGVVSDIVCTYIMRMLVIVFNKIFSTVHSGVYYVGAFDC